MLLEGINDAVADAERLAELLKRTAAGPAKVNVIPYNPVPEFADLRRPLRHPRTPRPPPFVQAPAAPRDSRDGAQRKRARKWLPPAANSAATPPHHPPTSICYTLRSVALDNVAVTTNSFPQESTFVRIVL